MAKSARRRQGSDALRRQTFKTRESYTQTLNRLLDPELYRNARVEVVRKELPKEQLEPALRPGLNRQYAQSDGLSTYQIEAHLTHLSLGQPGLHLLLRN